MRIKKEDKEKTVKKIDRLIELELLNPEDKTVLMDMLNSPDLENLEMLKTLINIKVAEKLSEDLNDDQKIAFEKIIDFLNDPVQDAVVLKGYAGTGKTFLIKRVIEYILHFDPASKIAITAPTNKAVHVLYKNAFPKDRSFASFLFEDVYDHKSNLLYSTTHKLLGMKEVITDKGEQVFVSDSMNTSRLSNYKYLIVDEISMLDDRICKDIMKFSKNLRIIFMGDPAQIPPVGKNDSIPFRKSHGYNFLTVELHKIMRQKDGNPIVAASFDIRENLKADQPLPNLKTDLKANGEGIIRIDSKTERHKVREILEKYLKDPRYQANSDFMKIIAWRNNTVDYLNKVAREIIFGDDLPTYVVGEKILAKKPIFDKMRVEGSYRGSDRMFWRIVVNTSEEMVVEEVDVDYHTFKEESYKLTCKVYKLNVKIFDPMSDRYFNRILRVIHEDSWDQYQDVLNKAKKAAIIKKEASFWVTYFDIMKWSANIGYGYAITAHKSQGSTYNNVMLIEEDIDTNYKVVERNRIKYTSYSRASERLYILK